MAQPILVSAKPGFTVSGTYGYFDLSNGNLANSPKNAALYFSKVSGTPSTISVTISTRNSTIPSSQYIVATVTTVTMPGKYVLNNLNYGETEIMLETTSLNVPVTVDTNITCFSN